jgi:hypothetical protein
MGINQFPAGSTGISTVIRSIQRGTAASAGNITISSVDTAKTIVNSFSTSSSGTAAVAGSLSSVSGSTSGFSTSSQTGTTSGVLNGERYEQYYGTLGTSYSAINVNLNSQNANAQNINLNASSLTAGTTNLVAGVNGVYLSNATTLVATGPCRYEVIEYV